MKKLVSFLTATALVAVLMTTQSCTKTCDAGYEGSDCKTEVRAKYYGTWTVNGTDNATPQGTYTGKHFTVSSGAASINQMTFNSSDLGLVLTVTLGSDGKTYTVDNTTTGGFTYSGTGSFTSTSAMTLVLTETGTPTTIYTFTGTK